LHNKTFNMNESANFRQKIEIDRRILFTISIFSYCCLIYSLIILPITDLWKIFVVYYVVGCFEQMFHHRKFAHKLWKGPKWLDCIGMLVANQSLLGTSIYFSAAHRMHHKFSDTEKDPHSPLFKSKFKLQFFYPWHEYNFKYSIDLIKDKLHLFFGKNYFRIMVIIWLSIILITSFNWWITIWMPGIALVVLIKNHLNYTLHGKNNQGYTNYSTGDFSKNKLIWGYLSFDGWHNNHHSNLHSWYLGKKWWELDIPGIVIAFFSLITFNFDNFKKVDLKSNSHYN